MPLQKWKLLSKKDVSPHKWFPIEMRTYELPSGKIVDDFSVTTLADVAMIIPKLTDGRIVLVNQFKPGVDEIMIQFPAGRIEPHHSDMQTAAAHELEEEVGIKMNRENFRLVTKLGTFPTKGSEIVHVYFIENCTFNSKQHFDENEDIELVKVLPYELDKMILNGDIWCAQTIAAWELAKKRFASELT